MPKHTRDRPGTRRPTPIAKLAFTVIVLGFAFLSPRTSHKVARAQRPLLPDLLGTNEAVAGWLSLLHAPDEPLLAVAISRSGGLQPVFEHPSLTFVAPPGLVVVDPRSGEAVVETAPGEPFRASQQSMPSTAGLLVLARQPEEPVGIIELRRGKKDSLARYRGGLLVVPAPKGGWWLVNIVGLESYLRGVVPLEMPPNSFLPAALEAQAVVARTYAVHEVLYGTRSYLNGLAYLHDGTACQAYDGVNVEQPKSDAAVAETAGEVLTYRGRLIPTYYSSTAGGHTESSALAWGSADRVASAISPPYLTGTPDRAEWGDFDSEERFRQFLEDSPPSFDDRSPYYRWEYEWTREELEATLARTLKQLPASAVRFIATEEPAPVPGPASVPASAAVEPARPAGETGSETGDDLGELLDIVARRRGVSGRILVLEILTTRGRWEVTGELNIRRLLATPQGSLLPSSAAVFDFERDLPEATPTPGLRKVIVRGTGYGHGVGMSQYGADGMARQGFTYPEILARYFPGTELIPVQSHAGADEGRS